MNKRDMSILMGKRVLLIPEQELKEITDYYVARKE